jgi:4'-phosphopantetheinyl transferase
LSHYTGVAPVDLCFERTEAGKPVLTNEASAIAFNVSHGPRWAACAVTDESDVGVDVDCETRRNRVDDIAAQYFHAQEQAALAAIQDEEMRRRAFFRYWTLKEAYIKARGETLNGARLQEYAFLPPAQQSVTLLNAASDGWQFMHRRFDGDHHLALASSRANCDTDGTESEMQYYFWQWDPVLNTLQTLTTCES